MFSNSSESRDLKSLREQSVCSVCANCGLVSSGAAFCLQRSARSRPGTKRDDSPKEDSMHSTWVAHNTVNENTNVCYIRLATHSYTKKHIMTLSSDNNMHIMFSWYMRYHEVNVLCGPVLWYSSCFFLHITSGFKYAVADFYLFIHIKFSNDQDIFKQITTSESFWREKNWA